MSFSSFIFSRHAALALIALSIAGCAGPKSTQETKTTDAPRKLCAKPVWPRDEPANHHGTVVLRFRIDPDGLVRETKVVKSSGYPALDEASQAAVMKCQFGPATENGVPVQSWAPVAYVW